MALAVASREDAQRLAGCYDALRICTLSDLSKLNVREIGGRRRVLTSAIRLMSGLGTLGSDAAQDVAAAGAAALRSALAVYDVALHSGLARQAQAQGAVKDP
jgi:hypothetical protein